MLGQSSIVNRPSSLGLVTGVDLIEVERFADTVARYGTRFLDRVFTAQEQAAFGSAPERLAARFAAKEAIAKALGTGIGDIRWRDIEIGRDERGGPTVTLHGLAQARADELGIRHFALSLSHTHQHAIAFVVGTA